MYSDVSRADGYLIGIIEGHQQLGGLEDRPLSGCNSCRLPFPD